MTVARITKSAVDKLSAGAVLWDTDVIGFGVRAGKAKHYLLRFRFSGRIDLVSIDRTANLQTIKAVRFYESTGQPRAIVIDVPEIAAAAQDIAATVADAEVVIQVQASGRQCAFGQRSDKVHRDETAAEHNRLGPGGSCLKP